MFDIVNGFNSLSNEWFNITLLIFALFRIYLEVIKFDFSELPLTKGMFREKEAAMRFHRNGLYLSVGYIILSAPFTLFS